MKRIMAAAVVAVALAVGATAIVVAVISDDQTTSGSVTMAVPADIDLYICEPGEPVTPGPDCGADDDGTLGGPAGPDELIFEGGELLTPASETTWDIRMKNIGPSLSWDIDAFTIGIQETNDPNADCDITPTAEPKILGKDGDATNDNHPNVYGGAPPGTMVRETYPAGTRYYVHVEAGDYEDLRLYFSVPAAGNECSSNAWDITIDWTVINEGSH